MGHNSFFPTMAAGYTGIITIDIHACKDLHGMDTNFLSDPYVVIRVGDQKVQTSVRKRTVNPTWESDNHFELHASNDHLLLLEVWDKDTLTSDDAVAQLEIPLLDLMGNMNGWHELQRHPKFDIINMAARAKHIAMDGVKTVTSQGSCGFGHYGDINMTITFEGSSGGFTSGSGGGGGGYWVEEEVSVVVPLPEAEEPTSASMFPTTTRMTRWQNPRATRTRRPRRAGASTMEGAAATARGSAPGERERLAERTRRARARVGALDVDAVAVADVALALVPAPPNQLSATSSFSLLRVPIHHKSFIGKK